MARQALVIGLGQFGMALAKALAHNGAEVIAVDTNPQHIADAAPHVADAVLMDGMDADALASLAPEKRDTCICAIGDENREASIIVTALLKQLGAPLIVARATDELHARILALVGAHEVINPERSYGEGMAVRLAWAHVKAAVPVGDTLVLVRLEVPPSIAGRSLGELAFKRRFGVGVGGLVRGDGSFEATPGDHELLRVDDTLVLLGQPSALKRLTEQV
jgi:trk system potassium uptake protein